ncbi:hypothetical protein L593_11945 [Salinarchaeum sp. Harcht-Bsk1]|uniref:hypothetical protein n=1 Tax=Salinarchaeum sp. Harcht-Bsk1 TaxID=1333523 RepID=UPI0003422F89|nr:hypothetical protein [Salinarchaeum sp. Harcht-Bsk1]AGN02332.1 hypothetical protein L593_11945 [Salinarchaeum sp. Harcht-Bsk1]
MTAHGGQLLQSKVVSDLGDVLERALDGSITGYATVEPQDVLLLDAEGVGVLAFEAGVPVAARHSGTGRVGREALAELSVPGPCRVELYERHRPVPFVEEPANRIPPGLPADRLVRDADLANRTRSAAADRGIGERTDADALQAFLTDEERVDAIRREAREEARARAEQWGLEDALVDSSPDGDSPH